VAALREEIRELRGAIASGLQNLPNLVVASMQQASMQGLNIEARDFQLAAFAPDIAKGVEPAAAEAMAVSQLELATKLALLGEEGGPIDDADVAALLGSDSEQQERPIEGFVSPSKVFLERLSGLEPPADLRKDLSSAFGAGNTSTFPPPTAPMASATTVDSTALDYSGARQLQPAASSQNNQNAPFASGERLITLTEAQLQQMLQRTQQSIPAAPFVPSAAVPINSGMHGAASSSQYWLPQTAFGAAAPSMMQQPAPPQQQPAPPQPQMVPQWQSASAMQNLMSQSTQYGGLPAGPVQQHVNPGFLGGSIPGAAPSAQPPFFDQQRSQGTAGLSFAPSNAKDVEAHLRSIVNARFDEQQQQAARINAAAVGVRVLPPFGRCSTLMEVSAQDNNL
jgi:hypothetical protein